MKELLKELREKSLAAIAGTETAEDLEALRIQYLGKKGELTAILKQMGRLSAEERPVMGQMANEVRAALEQTLEERKKALGEKALQKRLAAEALDVTIPGAEAKIGVRHPMYQVLDKLKEIFIGMGFAVVEDREVELAEYNFDKLNEAPNHPAREWTDTFYLDADSLGFFDPLDEA